MANSNKNALLAAYLVVGDDALKRQAVVRRLHVRLEEMGDLSFNLDTFDGAQADGEDVVAACNTIPFASEKRLVQVVNADKLHKSAADAVVEYLGSPSESTVLLLIAEKLAKNTRLYKAVLALGKQAVIDCAQPKSYKMQAHVRAMAPAHGITITDAAAAKLIERVGTDTVRLDTELQKLAVSHKGSQPVEVGEVEDIVCDTSTVKPWDFTDAFAARDLRKCMELMGKIESSSLLSIFAMCVGRVRELMCAQSVMAAGGSAAEVARELGVPDWKVKNHVRDARRFAARELREAIKSSVDAERRMKSGANVDAAFTDWVIAVLAR